MTVHVVIPGQPVAKGRPVVTRFGTFTPKKTDTWEATARLFAAQAMQGRDMLQGPLRVTVLAFFEIPSSWPKWKHVQGELENVWHITRPDADNIVKAALDACQGIVFREDSTVCSSSVYKRYSGKPRVEILVVPFDGIHSHSKQEKLL